ncbi:MAG: outer membrane protein assembly factor BamD [Verrucomicrobiota bacterium]
MRQSLPYLILLIVAVAQSLSAALVWRPGEGWVNEDSGQTLAASDAKAALQIARNFEAQEAWDNAATAYRTIVRRWPLSSAAGEAQFKLGYMLEKLAEFWPAYKAYQKVVDKYPGSQFFDLAIERQFSIGNLYLAGEPQRIWKIPLLPSMDKTVEIFQSVIDNAPYGPYAAPAHFKIGLARENQKKWSEAIQAYVDLLDRYPRSDLADDAQYQIGYAWYKASSQPDYDQSAARKSIEAFQEFGVRFPNSEKVAQAKSYISELTGRRIQGSYNIAKFYEKQANFKAALIYYNEVVRQNPESDQATEAKKRIDILRSKLGDEAPALEEDNSVAEQSPSESSDA